MPPLDELEPTNRVLKRAQYEAFAFTIDATHEPPSVVVRNESHADPSAHEYRVTISDGVPAACECPADEQYNGACKHRVAIAIRDRLLRAVRRAHEPGTTEQSPPLAPTSTQQPAADSNANSDGVGSAGGERAP